MIQQPKAIRKLLPTHIANGDGDSVEAVLLLNTSSTDPFKTEITCPICLGPLDKTWAVMACLHRFCEDCFHRSLRMELGSTSQKECPLCRVKLASRRSSRPDQDFDTFLEVISSQSDGDIIDNNKIYFAVSSNFHNDGQYEPWKYQKSNDQTELNSSANTSNQQQQQQLSPRQHYSTANNRSGGLDLSAYRRAHESNIQLFRKRQADWKTGQHREGGNNNNHNSSTAAFSSNKRQNNNINNNNRNSINYDGDRSPTIQDGTMNTNNGNSSIYTNANTPAAYSVYFSLSPTHDSFGKVSALKKPYLIVPQEVTVADMKIYLKEKEVVIISTHGNNNINNGTLSFSIFMVVGSSDIIKNEQPQSPPQQQLMELNDSITMKDVCSNYWDRQSKLELFYNIK